MANKRLLNLIDRNELLPNGVFYVNGNNPMASLDELLNRIATAPSVDAVEVVRCQKCVHAEPLDHNCELSTSYYLHCKLWRGEETKNVWHKYKKYYKDYSLVERDGYCDAGAKMDGGNEDG